MRVIGIDPGLANTGWSVVEPSGTDRFRIVGSGLIKTSKDDSFGKRLSGITDSLLSVVSGHSVKFASAEEIFFTRNVSSAIEVAKVIGSFVYAFEKNGVATFLWTPTAIKQTVAGGGKADKKMMERMVMSQIDGEYELKSDHEADSVAAAITFFMHLKERLLFS